MRDRTKTGGAEGMTQNVKTDVCPDCQGLTIQYRGKGKDSDYRVCPRWQEPRHLTETEITDSLQSFRRAVNPSGRFA